MPTNGRVGSITADGLVNVFFGGRKRDSPAVKVVEIFVMNFDSKSGVRGVDSQFAASAAVLSDKSIKSRLGFVGVAERGVKARFHS